MSGKTHATDAGAYVKLKVNDLVVYGDELISFQAEYGYGNYPPVLFMTLQTAREEIVAPLKGEGAVLELEYGQNDSKGIVLDKKKTRWQVFSREVTAGKKTTVLVKATIDAKKLWENSAILSTSTPQSMVAVIKKLPCFGSGKPKSGTMKLEVEDDLETRDGSKQKWLINDSSCIEWLNYGVKHTLIKDVPSGSTEWVYFPVINFSKDGDPTYYLRDLKLRCQFFDPPTIKLEGGSPPAHFSWEYKPGEKIPYTYCDPEIRGSEYVSKFWRKQVMIHDQAHGTNVHWDMVDPKLFKDSMSFEDQQKAEGNATTPKNTAFTGTARSNISHYNTNHYGKDFGVQKFQVATTYGFLRKINVKLTVQKVFLNLNPSDIVKVDIAKMKGTDRVIDKYLTTKYMVTKVYHEFVNGYITTHFLVSRDTFASG